MLSLFRLLMDKLGRSLFLVVGPAWGVCLSFSTYLLLLTFLSLLCLLHASVLYAYLNLIMMYRPGEPICVYEL